MAHMITDVLIERVLEYKKTFFYLFIGATVLSLAVTYWTSSGKKRFAQFSTIEEALGELAKGEAADQKSVENLERAIKAHPELASKAGGLLAQYFLAVKEFKEAEKYAEKGFKRTAFANSYYTDFAKTSLLIEERGFQEALKDSFALKEKMASDTTWMTEDFGNLLFGFNLLRIVFLHEILGEREMELTSAHEAKQFLESERGKALKEHFSEQNISMLDYFAERQITS